MIPLIFLVKCLLPLYSKPEEDANGSILHSSSGTLLVDSGSLPLAVCLDIFTPFLSGRISSNEVYGLNKK